MKPFLATYRTRRSRLQSTRKKTSFWLLLLVPTLLLGYLLLDMGLFLKAGADPISREKQEALQAHDEQVVSLSETQARPAPQDSGPPKVQKALSVSSGDTLMGLLLRAGLARAEAHTIITSLEEVFNPRRLRKGQEICLTFTGLPEQEALFHSLNLKLDIARDVMMV